MEDLKSVQGYQIRHAVRQYMRNIQYVYVGNVTSCPSVS
jgi:hypothetical protein